MTGRTYATDLSRGWRRVHEGGIRPVRFAVSQRAGLLRLALGEDAQLRPFLARRRNLRPPFRRPPALPGGPAGGTQRGAGEAAPRADKRAFSGGGKNPRPSRFVRPPFRFFWPQPAPPIRGS